MTQTSSSLLAAFVAVVLTVVSFQQAVAVPAAGLASVGTAVLA